MIVNANCRHALPLASESVDMCVTSPPYWGLRDYGVPGQLGLEPTPELYVAAMVNVFREVWRVMRDDGTLWLVLGDSYMTDAPGGATGGATLDPKYADGRTRGGGRPNRNHLGNLKHKDLVGIPWMVAFALRADGWYLRSEITWAKKAPMPEPVQDRPTSATEKIFLLAKSPNYFYDIDAVREPFADERHGADGGKVGRVRNVGGRSDGYTTPSGWNNENGNDGRNMRNWWLLGPEPYAPAHFATFPTAVVEPCILAGSRKGGIVLDPFAGSGTVGQVCRRHGRRFVGLDLNMTYLHDLALARAEGLTAPGLLATLPMFAGMGA